ncbi:major facilitator superfamily domain-containing protein [Dactylonectria estremocensis]|uniref:Lysosomal dipeptide transporter MFSD1 n=1 Tax=Dactylonectria estremocensis TaxID=1079267 RepID=A0A9P9F1H8_9HYPO|nr:major facilitator superfamily domain-containing protein [Dactylonectria estremocensis]
MASTPPPKVLSDEKSPAIRVTGSPTDDATNSAGSGFDENAVTKPIPWTYKWVALACVIAFPIGQNWTNANLGPLKNTLREELDITNAQFGVIASADSFINSVFPILGGMILDWWGPNPITICCIVIIFIGSVIAAAAIHIAAWRVLVAGHIVMGFGIAILDQAQQKVRGLAFAFGLENALSSTVGLVAGMVAIPIKEGTGWYGWTFWVPAFFCCASMLINIAYVFFERNFIPKQFRLTSARAKAVAKSHGLNVKRTWSWDSLLRLPWQYLMLPGTQILQSGGANGFGVSAADMIRMKGYTEEVAGFMTTGQKVIRIVGAPIIGWLIDRYGHRFHLVDLAPLVYILANSLIGFTNAHPIVALVFQSIAGLINGMPLNVSIPLLVADQDKLGTAFGVWRAFNNSGATIMEVVYGVVQDGTEAMGYGRVLIVSSSIKAVGFFVGLTYIFVDYKKLGRGITMTRAERERREGDIEDPDSDPLTRRGVFKPWTIYTLSALVAMIATA